MGTKIEDVSHVEAAHYEDVEKIDSGANSSRDIGARFLANTTPNSFAASDEKHVIRRIDRVLLPLMFVSFGLQYMDKALLNGAAQFGIVQDLSLYEIQVLEDAVVLNLNKFSNVTLIFYWGYFLGGKSPSFLSFGTILIKLSLLQHFQQYILHRDFPSENILL